MPLFADPDAERLSNAIRLNLSPQGLEKLDPAVAAELAKWTYNPNQPRNPHGEFGSGGSQSGQPGVGKPGKPGAKKPAVKPAPAPPKPATPAYAQGFEGSGGKPVEAAPVPHPVSSSHDDPSRQPQRYRPPARHATASKPKPKPVRRPGKLPSGNANSGQRAEARSLRQQANQLRTEATTLEQGVHELRRELRSALAESATSSSSGASSTSATSTSPTVTGTAAGSTSSTSAGSTSATSARVTQLRTSIRTATSKITSLRNQAHQLDQQASQLGKTVSRRLLTKTVTEPEAHFSFPIVKTETTPEGDLLVYGKATDGSVDSDEQIVDPIWSAKAIDDWLVSGGNLRVQHNPHRDPAGVGLEVQKDRDGDGAHWLKALVVEPTAQKLVAKGALRAFSVGIMRPRLVTDAKARGGRIVGGELGEISLVDRPANKNCAFSLVKADKNGQPEISGTLEASDEFLAKAFGAGMNGGQQPAPSPKDVARAITKRAVEAPPELPEVEKGELPQMRDFGDPVAQRLADALRAEKRDFSTDEREHLADTGAAMPDGSFPIKNGEDLDNAIGLAGNAKDPSAARAHIKERAAALGMSDKIPDTWKSANKGSKDCDNCGKSYDADTNMQECENCGHKLPPADEGKNVSKRGNIANFGDHKAKPFGSSDDDDDDDGDSDDDDGSDDDATKGMSGGSDSDDDDSNDDDDADDDNEDGGADDSEDVDTNLKSFCPDCGDKLKNKFSFCPGCGSKIAKPARTKIRKGRVTAPPAVPSDHAESKDTEPVPAHREPDGLEVADFEQDADMPTNSSGDGSGDMMNMLGWSKSQRQTQSPYTLMRVHDAFCAAYDGADVLNEYPSMKSVTDALDVSGWREQAMVAAAAGQLEITEKLLALARAGELVASADKAAVSDARAALHKDFSSMYPSVSLSPGEVCPSHFQRPYITDGHQREGLVPPGPEPDASLPPMAQPASAFNRGPLTAGHESPSPGDSAGAASKGDAPPPRNNRTYYTNAAKDRLKQRMQAIHDNIADEFPDLCPMAQGTHPTDATAKHVVPAERSAQQNLASVNGARRAMGTQPVTKTVTPIRVKAQAITPELIKAAMGPELAALSSAMDEIRAQLGTMKNVNETSATIAKQVGDLQAQVDYLGAQPDPAQAPIRSATQRAPGHEDDPVAPAQRRSLVQEMSATMKDEKLRFLKGMAASGDPVIREQAEEQIRKMLTA
jgi:hypothetical protein